MFETLWGLLKTIEGKMWFEITAIIVGLFGLQKLFPWLVKKIADEPRNNAEAGLLTAQARSQDVSDRLAVLDAMEARVDAIFQENADLRNILDEMRVQNNHLIAKIACLENKVDAMERREDELIRTRARLEARIVELEREEGYITGHSDQN